MAAVVLAAISCTKDPDAQKVSEKELVTMSFDATLATPTKTELGESNGAGGYKVLWSKDDAIKVYPHDGENQSSGIAFTTDIASASVSATFTGEIEAAEDYYAFYPGSVNAKWYPSNNYFGVTLSDNQTSNGIANGFMAAKADSEKNLQFDHVCGYVKFVIPDEYDGKISKVYFEGKNEESLAGYLWIFPDDMINNKVNSSPKTKLTLKPASGDAFSSGTYYFTVFPATLEDGFTLTFIDTEARTATKSTSKPATISAGHILNLGSMTGLSFDNAYAHQLPLNEDFSANNVLEKYIVDGAISVETNEQYISAGGEAPELMLKPQSSLTVNINPNGYDGYVTLSFNTNQIGRLTVSVQGEGVELQELTSSGKTYEYAISIPVGLPEFKLIIRNKETSSSNNARLDNLKIYEGVLWPQNLSFETSLYSFISNSSELSSFTGQEVKNAKTAVSYSSDNEEVATVDPATGVVQVKNTVGIANITAVAVASSQYRMGTASYAINVTPNIQTTEYTIPKNTELTFANDQLTATVNGITIVQAKKSGNTKVNTSYATVNTMRVYKGHTLSLSGKTFTKIVIKCKSGKYGNSLSVNTGTVSIDKKNNTVVWEGYSAAAVTIYNESTESNVQLHPDTIIVTYAQ